MPNITSTRAPWAPYGRTLLRRLKRAESDITFDLNVNAEGERIAPPQDGRKPSSIDLLDELELSQRRDSHDPDALRESDIDGWAQDDAGTDRPEQFIEPGKILMALRLAATFGSDRNFCTMALRPRALTVVQGFEPDQLSGAATTIGRLMLPEGWAAQMRAPHVRDERILQLIRPFESGSHKLHEQAYVRAESEILSALALPHPVMVLLPAGALLSANLRRVLPAAMMLAPFDREIMLALLTQTHSANGEIDRAQVAPLLPSEEKLVDIDIPSLLASLRAPTAAEAATALSRFLAPTVRTSADMTLEEIGGDSPAHLAAADIVSDLAAWKRGDAQWTELSHSLLISGEPGTGKSLLARAVAASAKVPLIESSFGTWQSSGHLGDMLREMRRSFNDAIRQRPSVLFVDEIDSVGARQSDDRHAATYRRNVINQFLAEIDQMNRAEGVVLIGATNHPEALDAAILRPGRFDRHCTLGRPSLAQIRHILSRALPDEDEADLTALARAFSGQTPAAIDAAIRGAKAAARRAGSRLTARGLLDTLPANHHCRDRRIAVHECGHAIVATLLGVVPIHRVQLSADGGATHRPQALREGLVAEFEDELTIILAGRAAEHLALGTISAGAGGSPDSDLSLASKLQLQFDREFGLGINGNAWVGPPDMQRLSVEERDRLRVKLDQFERRARQLLQPHQERLEKMAANLVQEREFNEEDLKPWLAGLAPVASPSVLS